MAKTAKKTAGKTNGKAAAKKTAKKPARKPNAAFMKPVTPSPALAEIVGAKPIPRTGPRSRNMSPSVIGPSRCPWRGNSARRS